MYGAGKCTGLAVSEKVKTTDSNFCSTQLKVNARTKTLIVGIRKGLDIAIMIWENKWENIAGEHVYFAS